MSWAAAGNTRFEPCPACGHVASRPTPSLGWRYRRVALGRCESCLAELAWVARYDVLHWVGLAAAAGWIAVLAAGVPLPAWASLVVLGCATFGYLRGERIELIVVDPGATREEPPAGTRPNG